MRFFKTGSNENDVFLGLRAATLHEMSKEHRTMPLDEIRKLLQSEIHEARSLALLILVRTAAKSPDPLRKQLYDFYQANIQHVNNWDLVDVSAPTLVGGFLVDKSRKPLMTLAKSKVLWERRIAIVATQYFIRQNDFADTLKIAKLLLMDDEDLIHKAVGWMLREVGKRDQPALEDFLAEHYANMPRTMLRYAIERFPAARRQAYLKGLV